MKGGKVALWLHGKHVTSKSLDKLVYQTDDPGLSKKNFIFLCVEVCFKEKLTVEENKAVVNIVCLFCVEKGNTTISSVWEFGSKIKNFIIQLLILGLCKTVIVLYVQLVTKEHCLESIITHLTV